MLKIGALVSGGGTNLQAIIDCIENGDIKDSKIVTVVSSKQNAFALDRAKTHNINGICINKKDFINEYEYENALISHFKDFDVDLIVMAGFMVVIGNQLIDAYRNRIMNIHPSLIPSFCGDGFYGLRVHKAVIEKGVKITGATVHFVTEETDAGPIILQKAVNVEYNDDAETLQKRVMQQAEWVIYPQAIRLFAEGRLDIVDNKVKILA